MAVMLSKFENFKTLNNTSRVQGEREQGSTIRIRHSSEFWKKKNKRQECVKVLKLLYIYIRVYNNIYCIHFTNATSIIYI